MGCGQAHHGVSSALWQKAAMEAQLVQKRNNTFQFEEKNIVNTPASPKGKKKRKILCVCVVFTQNWVHEVSMGSHRTTILGYKGMV